MARNRRTLTALFARLRPQLARAAAAAIVCTAAAGCNGQAVDTATTPPAAATPEADAPPQVNEPPQADEPPQAEVQSAAASQAEPATPETPKAAAEQAKPKTPVDESIDVAALEAARLSDEDLRYGWIRLFDGQSLFGWHRVGGEANWRVEDDAIVADEGEAGFLSTGVRFGDFEIQLEYRGAAETNSGVFLRAADPPEDPASDCYELNIAPPENAFPTGSLVERQRVEPDEMGELAADEWHLVHALVDRSHVQTWVDGFPASDFMDDSGLRSGKIMLQFREGPIAFRNIRVRPITYSVLPADDLAAWQPVDGEAFKYEQTDRGGVKLEGGRGSLELLQQLGDFAAQFEVQTLAPETNSGVFFRCIPGSSTDGYECQVQNGIDEDVRRPKDFGTGAIYRRVKARAVLAADEQPAFVTLVADGRSIATWVNGVQVVDWTDDREPKENPREGYRAEAGTLQLQAHDPTCRVRYDSLAISPIDPNEDEAAPAEADAAP